MVLHGLKEIAAELNCSPHVVRSLVKNGAPVRVLPSRDDKRGLRYLAEREALAVWVRCER
jgi:hypothetical protein